MYILYELGSEGTVLPVFVNAKGYLPLTKKVALNLSLDLGVAIGVGGYFNGGTEFYTSSAQASQSAVRLAEYGVISVSASSTWEKG